MRYSKLFPVLMLLARGAVAQTPIASIQVSGNQRLPAAALIAASGLHEGQRVTRKELDAAAQTLLDTGFFSSVNYRYDRKATGAFAVTLVVIELPATLPVILDIPGQDEQQLWKDLTAANAFVDRRIPDNERATAYYKQVIQTVLAKSSHAPEIVAKAEGDLGSHRVTLTFRPALLPRIANTRFEGNVVVPSTVLESAVAKPALGQEYTERYYRRIVELNLRPIYEERGYLTVSFPRVKASGTDTQIVDVTTQVDEGPLWRLGQVEVVGDGVPAAEMRDAAKLAIGQPANWKEFLAALERMKPVVTRDGYLGVRSEAVRSFHDDSHIVDVTVNVVKGRQILFGELHFSGIGPDAQTHAMAVWKLSAGAPLNDPYVTQYLAELVRYLGTSVKGVTRNYKPGAAAGTMDIYIAFRQ
jgi:outer membrane protein insertion porin family